MSQEKISQILISAKASIDHALFFPRVFALAARYRRLNQPPLNNPIKEMLIEEYEELSRRLDRSEIQESCSVRNILRARQLAQVLIDDKGEINQDLVKEAVLVAKESLYSIGPSRQYDSKRQEHLVKVLEALQKNPDLVRALKKITRPLSNKYVEDLIRQTLQLPTNIVITDAITKRAVLASWLSYLRQNVGSCFATAPAKIVQEEQFELFLQDMSDLIATGRLKRTFGGIEYSAPLSMTWGAGDLKKPVIMKQSSQQLEPEIWFSPGLMECFEAVNLLDKQAAIKHKANQIKNWIMPLFHQNSYHQPYFIITAEEIIRFVLLQAYGLTEQQVREYESRPRAMLQSQLLMQMPASNKNFAGIGEKCAYFLQQFEAAKSTFKALSDSALLKAWEFTLASFSETKLEFTRWNLYASLGMGITEPGGIGQCIYQIVQQKLETVNRKVQDIQYEYEMVYTQVKTLESRMRQATTEKEVQWLKMDYQNRMNEFYFLEEQRDSTHYLATSLVNLYESMHTLYLEIFKDYFQEVYDADVQEVTTGPFDDSPAGFRLLYKHGRANTSQWTRIKNTTEFIDALTAFFVATEPQIADMLELKGLEKDLSEIITAIINHVKTKDFLESAFYRMAVAHQVAPIKDPLEHLDRVEKKPWVYTSGGTMNTLVSCYYRLPDKPKEEARWVESELELLVFLVDTIKHIPHQLMDPYLRRSRVAMLMQSPTHAFTLKPNLPLFREAWLSEDFTYTYIRDQVVRPAEHFVETLLLHDKMIDYFIQLLAEKVPENYRPRFKMAFSHVQGPINPIFFREILVDLLNHDRGLMYGRKPVLSEDEIDSTLYSQLPLFPTYELKDRLHKILILLPGLSTEQTEEILRLFETISVSRTSDLIGAAQLQDICKALICLSNLQTSSLYDYHLAIAQAAQKLGFAMPMPLIFADTNWVKDEFGFVLNPGSGRFELWRLDYTGREGYPMSVWKEWVNGTRPDQTWGVYIKPVEYGQT